MADLGRVLIRTSGTELIVRVIVGREIGFRRKQKNFYIWSIFGFG